MQQTRNEIVWMWINAFCMPYIHILAGVDSMFLKNEFQESRDNIIHFDVQRQTKSQSKKHKKESVEMIKRISFPESQENVSADILIW